MDNCWPNTPPSPQIKWPSPPPTKQKRKHPPTPQPPPKKNPKTKRKENYKTKLYVTIQKLVFSMEYYITVMDIVKCTLQKQPMTEWQGYNRLSLDLLMFANFPLSHYWNLFYPWEFDNNKRYWLTAFN